MFIGQGYKTYKTNKNEWYKFDGLYFASSMPGLEDVKNEMRQAATIGKGVTEQTKVDTSKWKEFIKEELDKKGDAQPVYRPLVEMTQAEKNNRNSADRRKIPENILIICWLLKYGLNDVASLKLMTGLFINDWYPSKLQDTFKPECTSPEWLNDFIVVPVTQIAMSLCHSGDRVKSFWESGGLVPKGRYTTLKKLIQDAITSVLLQDFLSVLHMYGPDPVPIFDDRQGLNNFMTETYCVYHKVQKDENTRFTLTEAVFKTIPGLIRSQLNSDFYDITRMFIKSDTDKYPKGTQLKDFRLHFKSIDKATSKEEWVTLFDYFTNILYGMTEPPIYQTWAKKPYSDREAENKTATESSPTKTKKASRKGKPSDESEEEDEGNIAEESINITDVQTKALALQDTLKQLNLTRDVKSKVADLFVSIGLGNEVITIDDSEEEKGEEEQEEYNEEYETDEGQDEEDDEEEGEGEYDDADKDDKEEE